MHCWTPLLEHHPIAESINILAKLNKHIENIESISLKFSIFMNKSAKPGSKTANHGSKSAKVV